jgi:hypothetical protein
LSTTTERGIDVALRLGFHKMPAFDMAQRCRAMLDKRPTCKFADVQPGKTYVYKAPYGSHMELLTVDEVTPKRTQAVASVNGNGPRRIYRGSYEGTFSELDADLIALSPLKHEEVLKAAVERGLDVPPEVRREYPALFVEIPERFAQSPRHTAAERVKNALNPTWVLRKEPVGPATFDAQIEEAHRQIAVLQDTRCQAVVANPDTAADYDRYLAEHRADIDFYRWLRRLVDVGGVFHIPAPKAAKIPA